MRRTIGLLMLLLAAILLCQTATASVSGAFPAEPDQSVWPEGEAVLVKNYDELLAAVNEQKVNRILISAKYKDTNKEYKNMEVEAGRVVTIRPEKGESMVLNGRLDFNGEGAVDIQNITITGGNGEPGLWAGGGGAVRAESVLAGKGASFGCPAAVADNAYLSIGTAVGSDGKTGLGGDAVIAMNGAVVEVREAVGGSASQGIGGAGVYVLDGSEAIVTGSATGGSGLYGGGKGALIAYGGKQTGTGTVTDGAVTEGKRTLDPAVITNQAFLINAIRNGETDIQLDAKFKAGGMNMEYYLGAMSEKPIRITGNPDGKHPVLDGQLNFVSGSWELSGTDITSKQKNSYGLWAHGSSDITLTGNIRSDGMGIYVCGTGRVTIHGDVNGKNGGSTPTICNTGELSVTGAVRNEGPGSVIDCIGGKTEINGDVHGKTAKEYAMITNTGELYITGAITNDSQGQMLACMGGKAVIKGDIRGKSLLGAMIIVTEGELSVTGDVTDSGGQNCALSSWGKMEINGNVRGKSNQTYPMIYNQGELSITGTVTDDGPTQAIGCHGGHVVIQGDVRGKCKGQYPMIGVYEGETVINGDVICEGQGVAVDCRESAKVLVEGSISGKGRAIYISDGEITVKGSVSSTGNTYMIVSYGGKLEIGGDVVADNKNCKYPNIWAEDGFIHIAGSVSGNGKDSVVAVFGGTVQIDGDVSGPGKDEDVIWIEGGSLTIGGNVTAEKYAVYAKGGEVTVNGNVMVKKILTGPWGNTRTKDSGRINILGEIILQ